MRRTRGVDELLRWCTEQGVEVDPRLAVRVAGDGSMGVFATADASVDIGESLVRIPKTAVLSTKNCFQSRDVPAARDMPALELAFALLTETLQGRASAWYGYLQSLPEDMVALAVFWGVDGDEDGVEARGWLRGTEVEKILVGRGEPLLDRITGYFEREAKPVLDALGLPSSLTAFYRAYSLVSSRAFLVDAYHGLALVPLADAFNHVEDNHVHLESDYDVCTTCGSLDACAHDSDDGTPGAGLADTCEMVSNLPIRAGEEVFNTYEKGLTNAQLMSQYGFALDANENNIVSWGIDEVVTCEATRRLWDRLLREWAGSEVWDEWPVYRDDAGLRINADGEISHGLWLLALSIAAQEMNYAEETLCPGDAFASGPSAGLLRRTAATVVKICEGKMGSAHCQTIAELLDAMPAERRLTRQAIAYALDERKLVETCCRSWQEMNSSIHFK